MSCIPRPMMSRMTGASRGPVSAYSMVIPLAWTDVILSLFAGCGAGVKRARHAAPTADVHHSAECAYELPGQDLRAAGQKAIGEAGDANRFAFEARRAPELRNILRRHDHARGKRLPELRAANHRRVGEAGTHRRRGNAGPAQLLGERLRQRQNIGLGGGVSRNSRDWHERCRRGYIENGPAPRLSIGGINRRVSDVSATTLTCRSLR